MSDQPMTDWIRLVATPADKSLLEQLRVALMADSLSATVRLLIRQEAQRQGIVANPQND